MSFPEKVDSLAKKIAQPAGHAISVVYSLFLESLHFHEVLAILVELLAIQYFLYYLFHCVILSFSWFYTRLHRVGGKHSLAFFRGRYGIRSTDTSVWPIRPSCL